MKITKSRFSGLHQSVHPNRLPVFRSEDPVGEVDGEVVICAPDGRTDFDRRRAVFGRRAAPTPRSFPGP
jgi:hypothetical protein